jgi:hypothetical protein
MTSMRGVAGFPFAIPNEAWYDELQNGIPMTIEDGTFSFLHRFEDV